METVIQSAIAIIVMGSLAGCLTDPQIVQVAEYDAIDASIEDGDRALVAAQSSDTHLVCPILHSGCNLIWFSEQLAERTPWDGSCALGKWQRENVASFPGAYRT